jgi:hypothetical protein
METLQLLRRLFVAVNVRVTVKFLVRLILCLHLNFNITIRKGR